jgi:(E)-4-hydroxy-3-methylbut-2-enyl-diphosphate synthase
MGADNPIRLQSMTNTNTLDTRATVEQIQRIADAGADYARMTTRSMKEAKNLEKIRQALRSQGYRIPLVADVHFNPDIAEKAAAIVEKVRINPGNYAIGDTRKGDFREVKRRFRGLLETCKANGTALRIGVNHGSLAQRIMDAHGDTPEGMVESAMEFIRICEEADFYQVVLSMKSSNTRVMVQANRLLVRQMMQRGRIYPLHLGVTEAGEGEDGRIKSAIGIATLLNDGIGDTIRVSLTEAPEKEIPVARTIMAYASGRSSHERIRELDETPIDPFHYSRRKTRPVKNIGGENPPVVVMKSPADAKIPGALIPEYLLPESLQGEIKGTPSPLIVKAKDCPNPKEKPECYPLFDSLEHYPDHCSPMTSDLCFVHTAPQELDQIPRLKGKTNTVLILSSQTAHPMAEQRRFILEMIRREVDLPVILHQKYREKELEKLQIRAASDTGGLLIDGLADGLLLENDGPLDTGDILQLSFGILQASRSRIYKTEFISCPGCGRTQFNLEKTAASIRRRLGHLKGLKIAVMGCIVNGPGEMADADYGYVGSGPGKITLYRNREVIRRNIPESQAVEELIQLIKDYGDWKEEE